MYNILSDFIYKSLHRFIGEQFCIEEYTIVKRQKGNAWYSYVDPWLNDTGMEYDNLWEKKIIKIAFMV